MVSIEEAMSIISGQEVSPVPREVAVKDSVGYWLAEEIVAPFDLPSFDNSAMDGYALCGYSNSYAIVGEVAAGGTSPRPLKAGEALRIFTGGKVPENTTAVIMQEKTVVSEGTLHIQGEILEGKNIRRRGEEITKGQPVFEKGHLISPATIGLLSSLGISMVHAFDKPSVRLITTGNELVTPGLLREEGQIYESNGASLSSALSAYGFKCMEQVQIKDDFEAISTGIGSFLERSDVLLLSGGISVGDYDFVGRALEENGVKELFYKVRQKPGKPLYFGRKESKFIFALPGNPASSLTCMYVYVLPLLQKMSGAKAFGPLWVSLPLGHDYEMKSDRPSFYKAKVDNKEVILLDGQGSSMIHSMAQGNALVYLPAPGYFKKGDLVECTIL